MTVLSSVQEASRLLGMSAPTSLFASSLEYEIQIRTIANQAAKAIARQHDWRLLSTLKTQTGDGSSTAFALPTDYDRMPVKASVYLTSAQVPMSRVENLDDWMDIQLRGLTGFVGWWMLLGGQMNIYPAMSSSDSAKYYYQSNLIVDPASGSNKTDFTLDTDAFRLSEHVLTLAIVWRWRAQQGLDYDHEKQNFDVAMAQEAERDKGSRVLKIGTPRIPDGVSVAFPGTITV
jgi:hypothetical protein